MQRLDLETCSAENLTSCYLTNNRGEEEKRETREAQFVVTLILSLPTNIFVLFIENKVKYA